MLRRVISKCFLLRRFGGNLTLPGFAVTREVWQAAAGRRGRSGLARANAASESSRKIAGLGGTARAANSLISCNYYIMHALASSGSTAKLAGANPDWWHSHIVL